MGRRIATTHLPSAEVAALAERELAERGIDALAFGEILCARFPERFRSPGSGQRILHGLRERDTVTLARADTILTALGRHLSELPSYAEAPTRSLGVAA